jgi:hypothetical protein
MPASKPAQDFVPVEEVRSGVIILKNGGYRAVLMCSSLNFGLKGADEQQAIIGGFQNFLNTLDFPIQIVIHSRKTDIRPYLALLEERMSSQTTELLRIQLREYIAFIRNFIEGSDIMTKTFYVVVPFGGAAIKTINTGLSFFGGGKKADSVEDRTFEESRVQLEQRMALVTAGLASCGLRAVPLNTEELIELLYRSFNVADMENPIRYTND